MNKIYVRVNGRGNAWPVQLGSTHPFYDRLCFEDMSNASFSLISENKRKIEWSVLIDGGHGAIQYLLKNENRIPEAIFITHPHHDHLYSIDWVIQSFYRANSRTKKYPVYATKECFSVVLNIFPHLEEMIEFKTLEYSTRKSIVEIDGLSCTAFPVYHGISAKGAAMFMFEINGYKIVFTGDILCPLLTSEDYNTLQSPDVIYADCNNRFPYPKSNHWSVIPFMPDLSKESHFLSRYIELVDEEVFAVLRGMDSDMLKEKPCFSILDFVKSINAENVQCVHYSGNEDAMHYGEEMLSVEQLQNWFYELEQKLGLKFRFRVPKVGDKYYLD